MRFGTWGLLDMAIGFVLSHKTVTSAVVGPRTPSQLSEVLETADTRLDQELIESIDRVVAPGTLVSESDRG